MKPSILHEMGFTYHDYSTLEEMGCDVGVLEEMVSVKELSRTLIGSAHKEEVKMLSRGLHGLFAISTIQASFVNSAKRKLDRHAYLEFLANANNASRFAVFGQITAAHLQNAINILGEQNVLFITMTMNEIEAKDTFIMLYNITVQEDESKSETYTRHVINWLNRHKTFGSQFHSYLTNKENLVGSRPSSNNTFPQAKYQPVIDKENEKLASSNLTIILPHTRSELSSIGKQQRHCVGNNHYAAMCSSGSNIIFSIVPLIKQPNKDELTPDIRHGYTFQFERNRLIQGKGFVNCDAPSNITQIAKPVIKKIINANNKSIYSQV